MWDRPDGPTPRQRGFDRFFGILGGYGSLFNPYSMMLDDTPINAETADFYFTDAITDHALQMIDESAEMDKPFYLYLSYTAPHWPLHARDEDIAKYEGMYRGGWDALRTARHEELKGMGVLNPKWEISPRDVDAPPWPEAAHQDWEDLRMAVYAAMIDRVDQCIGQVMAKLEQLGQADNTLFMFLSDNGGDAELFMEDTDIPVPSVFAIPTVDGRQTRVGNIPDLRPGGADTFMSYDLPWANVSNTPFRLFKRWIHEGGISTPFIMHWPDRIKQSGIINSPAYISDITATCIAAAGASYPAEYGGNSITPLRARASCLLPMGGRGAVKPRFSGSTRATVPFALASGSLSPSTTGRGNFTTWTKIAPNSTTSRAAMLTECGKWRRCGKAGQIGRTSCRGLPIPYSPASE